MAQTGLGIALRTLRDRRTLSLREINQISGIDHAYVHRLETGEKTNPSGELIEKLLKVLKPTDREASMVKWLVDHEADPKLVSYVLGDKGVDMELFAVAASSMHRGSARPDPATHIARIRRALKNS